MVWAGAIPHSYLESLLEQNPNLVPADVFQALMEVLVAEIEELHNSLIRYGCNNFVLIGILIVHGAPSADTPYDRHRSVRVSASKKERSVAHVTFLESRLRGAHFKHADGPDLVKMDRNHVMQFVSPYMAWQSCGPDPIYNRYLLYNHYMKLSIWDAPSQCCTLCAHQACEKGSTEDQAAAHAVHDLSELHDV